LDTSVNGPAGSSLIFDGAAWDRVDWRVHEERVRRLRCRIFKAAKDGDLAGVRNLQKLLLRSWSNTLVSVRQVTQRNTGRRTAGIDGQVALTAQARAEVAAQVHATRSSWRPLAVRRVYIPKAGDKTKMRPLGIPVITDRCHQARVRNALEPEWEARFEPRSYGFRPGRGCHDAIESLYNTLRWKSTRVWILDADLAGAFDNIDHDHLLAAIGDFPAKRMVAEWLKAGIVEAGKGTPPTFSPTEAGTPQGGLCSAEHKPPYEQFWVMCSAGLSGLVGAGAGGRALRISPRILIMWFGVAPGLHGRRSAVMGGLSKPPTPTSSPMTCPDGTKTPGCSAGSPPCEPPPSRGLCAAFDPQPGPDQAR
jgi:retron-type reverse transcriptase